jgi:putative aldouronate transport system substrate-binding protein
VVKLDLPALGTGAPAACLAYPKNPVQVADTPPLSGETVTFLNVSSAALPPPVDKNQFWQELNRRSGGDIKMSFVASKDYQNKMATLVAGGDLPDMTWVTAESVPKVEDVLKAKFQDLSQWLSGDAVQQFPNLAALPTVSWRNMVFDGGIYGIPYVVPVVSSVPQVRQDIFDKTGVGTPELADGQDFLSLCKELTESKRQRWAFGDLTSAQTMAKQMTGCPNEWRVADGVFTSAYETDEYKDAISAVKQMWDAGYFQPDVATGTSSARALFIAGKVSIAVTGYISWSVWAAEGILSEPDFKTGGLVLPKWDGGGQSAYHQGSGANTMTSLKQADPKRIETLLRLLDWIATPFGSAEYLFFRYGIPGHDYTLRGTDPVPTDAGVNEVQYMYVQNLSRPVIPIYDPGHEASARDEYEYLANVMKSSLPLPTVGLVSDTDLTKGAALDKVIGQTESDIILGHKPLSSWDSAVKTWKAGGGDAIAQEYAKAYAAADQ